MTDLYLFNYSDDVLNLCHSYCELHADDYWECMIDDSDQAEVEYCADHIDDFRVWAEIYGYNIIDD